MEIKPTTMLPLHEFKKLTGYENYISWRFNMEMILQHEDLYDAIIVDDQGTVIEKDSKKLLKAKAKINLMLSETVQTHIRSLASARDVWLKLDELYGSNGLYKQLKLLKKLLCMKSDGYVDVKEYLDDIMNTAARFDNEFVSQEFLGMLMLIGLPQEYDALVAEIDKSGIKVTVERVKSKIENCSSTKFILKDNSDLLARSMELSDGNEDHQCQNTSKLEEIKDSVDMHHSYKKMKKDTGSQTDESCGETSDFKTDQNFADVLTPAGSINILNDDCLLNIFSYLSPIDRIRIERVCKKWKRISQESWKTINELNICNHFKTKNITLNHFEEVLRRSGKFLTDLDCNYLNRNRYNLPARASMEVINKYCKRLTYLDLSFTWKENNYLDILDDNVVQNLESLYLGHYKRWSDEHLSAVLRNAVNLEKLYLVGYDFSNGNILHNLSQNCESLTVFSENFTKQMLKEVLETHPNIHSLKTSIPEVTANDILPFTEKFSYFSLCVENFFEDGSAIYESLKFPNLKFLDLVDYCDENAPITAENLLAIVKNSPMIEAIDLEGRDIENFNTSNLKFLNSLKKLTALNVADTTISDIGLINLTKETGQLKDLNCHDCKNISESGVEMVIAALPELTSLVISSSLVTESLIESASALVLNRTNNVPLTIHLKSEPLYKVWRLIRKLKSHTQTVNRPKSNMLSFKYEIDDCECGTKKSCICPHHEDLYISYNN